VAELKAARAADGSGRWAAAQRRAQYAAVLRLRWQMFRNGLRRKGGKGDLAAMLMVLPFALLILGALCAGAGAAAGWAAASGHLARVSWVLWGIFLLSQMVNLNIGQPGTTFDPTQLIRFPMTVASYTAVRLFFGMLAAGNIVTTMMSLAAAAGVTIARPGLWAWAFGAMAVFALVNVLFTRMVFAWVDRWLSTRRAREVMTALIFVVSMGAQALNFLYNPAYHNRHVDPEMVRRAHDVIARVEPYLKALPPELSGDAVVAGQHGDAARFAGEALASLAWGGVFLTVFGLRMRTEYGGENLSDAANAVSTRKAKAEVVHTPGATVSPASEFVDAAARPMDVVRAVAAKELLYLRRNTGLFYGLIMPLLMVMIFAGRWTVRAGSHGPLILLAALTYGLLGVFTTSFNSFGLDGTGAQTYFFAPVRMREVVLGKNVLCAGVALVETVAILAVLTYEGSAPSALLVVAALLWVVMALLLQLTVGNYMSLRSPKRIESGRTAQKQARPASAFLSMGILLGTGLVGAAVIFLAGLGKAMWAVPLVFAATAAGAGWVYLENLNKLDAYAWVHRDALFEELQRKA
jgi:ABC-2 type transport system permease protein